MIATKTTRPPDAYDISSPLLVRDPLSRSIHDLALQERDDVRRRDWSAARSAAEERLILQEARQYAAAKRWA